jgi:hypothetical protein
MTSPKPKAPPEPPVSDDPEQFQRFVEAARELGIEEVGLPYERAIDLILSRRKGDRPAEPGESRSKRGRKKKSPS